MVYTPSWGECVRACVGVRVCVCVRVPLSKGSSWSAAFWWQLSKSWGRSNCLEHPLVCPNCTWISNKTLTPSSTSTLSLSLYIYIYNMYIYIYMYLCIYIYMSIYIYVYNITYMFKEGWPSTILPRRSRICRPLSSWWSKLATYASKRSQPR